MSPPLAIPSGESPLVAHLNAVRDAEQVSFHMPGHKGGSGAPPAGLELLGADAYAADLSELGGFDYLHGATGPLLDAQRRAAELFGADHSWYLVNGATVGNIASICALAGDGDKILVARDSHRSVYAGLAVAGAVPVYLPPVRNDAIDGLFGVALGDVAALLDADPQIRAVHVTSPSFYGFTIPIAEIAACAHGHGVPLIVDEAHGTHFAFNDGFPPSALSSGADLVVQSPHKTLGSLTQSSLLHTAGPRVDRGLVTSLLGMLQSSSPSALLTVSLDAALGEMAASGAARCATALALASEVRTAVAGLPRLVAYGDEVVGSPGIASYDPTKIVIDVQHLGTTGFAAGRWLREHCAINPEFSDLRRLVFSITIGDDLARVGLLIRALGDLASSPELFADHPDVVSMWPTAMPEAVQTPRASFRSSGVAVPVDRAIGRVTTEMIVPYPPGVPLLVSGERITDDVVGALRQLLAAGCRIVGPADPTLSTLRCVEV